MDGEISTVKSLPYYGSQRGYKRHTRRGHSAAGEEVAIVWNVERMERATSEWGVRGRIAWIGLALTFFIPLKASELFVEDISKMFVLYCLREEDGSFLCGKESVERGGLP